MSTNTAEITQGTTTSQEVAQVIHRQIGGGVLMSLGAHNLGHGNLAPVVGAFPQPGLVFNARILPFTKSGKRSGSARVMLVVVSLNAMDYYDVLVTYNAPGDRYGAQGPVVHYEAADVDFETLPRLLLALDYDGETVLNPRYA